MRGVAAKLHGAGYGEVRRKYQLGRKPTLDWVWSWASATQTWGLGPKDRLLFTREEGKKKQYFQSVPEKLG